jgi:hypothetical protein
VSGEASQWFTLLERNQGKPSWEESVRLINQSFGPPLRSNPLDKLIQLCRDGMVAEIQSKFLTLLARCDRSAEKHWLMSPTCSTLLQQSPQGRQARTGRPLLLLTPAPASGAKDSTPAAQRLKRLTAAEMAAKREKVRCYNCTGQFSREHLKTCPMKGPTADG